MSEYELNPMGNLYKSFLSILDNITIKYAYKAEEYETKETKMYADSYMDAINKKDSFLSYDDYIRDDYLKVGIPDTNIIETALKGDTSVVPYIYRDELLQIRRKRVLDMFEEKNNYYRMLNGLPDVEDKDYFYVTKSLSTEYGISMTIPIHEIQDYYNKIVEGKGDYLISIVEGSGLISRLIKQNPDKKYLKFIGSNRISIYTARSAKNFEIIQLKKIDMKQSLIDSFSQTYEQCREYFVKTIYISNYRNFIEYYDNFIAMCIMVMTVQQLVVRQMSSGIKREFFDIYAVRTLYEAYDIPYNLNIDDDTQSDIVQNLNLLIQNKATDKVIYNIANLLGFTNINVYKYYLSKEQKFDSYGLPIIKYTEKFNTDTGEVEVVPDYEAMYNIYFQKAELNDDDFINSFNDSTNHIEYEDVVSEDPYWWEDNNIYDRIWTTEYNFVESKYLSLGISYSMTEILFENIIFLKLIFQQADSLFGVSLKLNRILENSDVSIFDAIVLLLTLTAAKHNLYGEIISVPTQIISVLDYIKNTEDGDINIDTLKFNFNYFFNPDETERKEEIDNMKEDLIKFHNKLDKKDSLADNLSYNFEYFSYENTDREENIKKVKSLLGEDDYNRFKDYVDKLSTVPVGDARQKIGIINDMLHSVKNLYKLISYNMTKTDDKKTYEELKQLYDTLFYSKEVSEIFTITGELTGHKRTAWTYFEFLYHRNPSLYNAVYEIDLQEKYLEHLIANNLEESDLSYDDFLKEIEYGNIFIDYSTVKGTKEAGNNSIKNEKLYFYINHVIGRLELIIEDIEFLYLMNDAQTPLENLLIKLVRFFKSYTVDVLGLDILFICDFKAENTVKLFDILHYMEKTDEIHENMRISYADAINTITSSFEKGDKISLFDKMCYDAFIVFTEEYGKRNSIRMKDSICSFDKSYGIQDNSLTKMNDEISSITSTKVEKDSSKFNDRIVKMWFSD